jgi:hypothetical protein
MIRKGVKKDLVMQTIAPWYSYGCLLVKVNVENLELYEKIAT